MTALRIVVAAIGFLGAIFAPWWVPATCIVLLSIRFRAWEAVLLGLLMDLLWLPAGGLPLFTAFAIVVVWIFEPLRSEFLAQ